MSNLKIVQLDFLNMTEEQWHDLLTARTKFMSEASPEDPVTSFEDQRSFLSEIPNLKDTVVFWLFYDERQNCVGFCAIQHPKPVSPDYEANKDRIYVEPTILSAYRNQGFAKQFLPPLLNYAKAVDASWIQWDTKFDSGHRFSEKLEAIEAGRQGTNCLALKEVDWDLMQTWIDEGQSRNPNVNLIRFTNLPLQKLIEPYCELVTIINTLQPRDDLIGIEYTLTPEELKKTAQNLIKRNIKRLVICTQEANGELSGMTDMSYKESNRKYSQVYLTGVRPEYQKRGLAKWLKAAMLVDLKEANPDVEFVITENFNSNQPMLSINNQMGFTSYEQFVFYKIKVAELEKRVRALLRSPN